MKLSDALRFLKNTEEKEYNCVTPGQILFVNINGTVIRGITDSVSVDWRKAECSNLGLNQFFESIVNDLSSEAEVTIRLRMPTVIRSDKNAKAEDEIQCMGSTAWLC